MGTYEYDIKNICEQGNRRICKNRQDKKEIPLDKFQKDQIIPVEEKQTIASIKAR